MVYGLAGVRRIHDIESNRSLEFPIRATNSICWIQLSGRIANFCGDSGQIEFVRINVIPKSNELLRSKAAGLCQMPSRKIYCNRNFHYGKMTFSMSSNCSSNCSLHMQCFAFGISWDRIMYFVNHSNLRHRWTEGEDCNQFRFCVRFDRRKITWKLQPICPAAYHHKCFPFIVRIMYSRT